MSTEDDARLRQLMRMSHELPEPDWNLFKRATKRFSKFKPAPVSMSETQRKYEQNLNKILEKDAKVKKRDKK